MAKKVENVELRLTPMGDKTKIEYIHHGLRKKTYLSRSIIDSRAPEDIRAQHEKDAKDVYPRLRFPTGVNR